MKTLILTIPILYLSLFTIGLKGQDYGDRCERIGVYDSLIYQLDASEQLSPKSEELYIQLCFDVLNLDTLCQQAEINTIINTQLFGLIYYPGITRLERNANLDCIKSPETLTCLEYVIDTYIRAKIDGSFIGYGDMQVEREIYSPSALKDYRNEIRRRIDEHLSSEFTMYRFRKTSGQVIKGVYLAHSNDYFSFISNDDRDMTGSMRIEIATDLLKFRLFNSFDERWIFPSSKSWYSYQTIFIGGEGYTPYITDTVTFCNPQSIDSTDRPFGCFTYFGWAKYNILRSGRIAYNLQLKFGKIGSETPGIVQSIIHRDLSAEAITPNGWGSQIACGGRIAFGLNLHNEFLINESSLIRPGLFVSCLTDINLAHDMSYFGAGLSISNRDLKERGGIDIAFNHDRMKLYLNYSIWGRYVVHNSMLEGYGFFRNIPDENPSSPKDIYVLSPDYIDRWVWTQEIKLGISFHNSGIVYRHIYSSPEFHIPLSDGSFGPPANKNRKAWHHVGSIGLWFTFEKRD